MSKKIIFLLLICFHFFIQASSQVNSGMPDVLEVVKTFFSKYDVTSMQYQAYLKFEKKKEGWFVEAIKFEDNSSFILPMLFWNKQMQDYEKLNLSSIENTSDDNIENSVTQYLQQVSLNDELYFYRRNLYYGYDGWDWDVINYAEKNPSLTDTLLESLARAYSNYAINYFYNQWGAFKVNDDSDREKLLDSEPIAPARAKKFTAFEIKAIETYEKLNKLNPAYETRVGNVYSRMMNEKFFAFTTLRFVNYEDYGKPFLNDITFPDSLMETAKSMLNEIKPNSILFTTGDNITYPIWLLQLQGKRTDIIVVDFNLLGLRRAVSWFDKKYGHKLFSADSSIYMNPHFDYALFNSEYATNDTIELGVFLNQLYTSPDLKTISKENKTTYFSDDKRFKFLTKNIFLNVNAGSATSFFANSKIYNKMYPCINRDYLFMNEILELDIIAQNFIKKHIYFSFPPEDPCYEKYIDKGNFTYEFTAVSP